MSIIRRILVGVVLASIATGMWWLHARARDEQDRAYKRAIADADLPVGAEKDWVAFVEERLRERIKPAAQALAIMDESSVGPTFVSFSTPYTVTCSTYVGMAVVVQFGDNVVEVLDVWTDDDGLIPGDKSPPLAVHRDSAAAKNLSEILCRRTAAYVAQVMKQ